MVSGSVASEKKVGVVQGDRLAVVERGYPSVAYLQSPIPVPSVVDPPPRSIGVSRRIIAEDGTTWLVVKGGGKESHP